MIGNPQNINIIAPDLEKLDEGYIYMCESCGQLMSKEKYDEIWNTITNFEDYFPICFNCESKNVKPITVTTAIGWWKVVTMIFKDHKSCGFDLIKHPYVKKLVQDFMKEG